MDIIFFLLSYVLPAVVGIVLIWLLFVAIDAFGFLGTMALLFCISGGILLVCKIIDVVKGNVTYSEDEEESFSTDDEDTKDTKKWGYRKAGRYELKFEGGMKSCRNCKHYSTAQCYLQLEDVDPSHICAWYEEG